MVEHPERPKEERPSAKNSKRPRQEEAFEMEYAPIETCEASNAENAKKPCKGGMSKVYDASMKQVHHTTIAVDDWPSQNQFQMMPEQHHWFSSINRMNQERTVVLQDRKESSYIPR